MIEKFKQVEKLSKNLDEELETLKYEIEGKQKEYQDKVANMSKLAQIAEGLNEEEFKNFIQEPYIVVPTGKQEEWFVAVPKFIRMNLGWLDHTTETFNVFRINKFMKWLGNIPKDIEKKFKFESKLPLKVFDDTILTGREHQEATWNKYNHFLTRREGQDKIKIKRGYEFKLLAQLISDGILPFMPRPIEKEDLRVAEFREKLELRDYQTDAWNRFLEVGAVGIYWAYSAGKTWFGLHAGGKIIGKKLVVVPTRTLVEQWEERIKKFINVQHQSEWEVVTYHSFDNLRNKEFALVIFDECQHLPANTFSKFATLNAKYRIGLCLDKNTLLETPDGKKRICNIKIGDKIKSFNFKKRVEEYKPVLKIWNTKKEVLEITFSTPEGIKKIRCSPEHKIFVNGKFKKAKDLSSEETIIFKGGKNAI